MEIIVDDREKAVIPFMAELSEKYKIIYKVQRNQTGDYAIIYKDNILLIIERKTWADLAASMRDGRKENVKKLLNLREQTGCNLAYLIEGDATPSFTRKYGRLPVKNLRAHLDHLMFRDNIHVIYSKNELYTAERLFELGQNYLSNKEIIKKIKTENNDTNTHNANHNANHTANDNKTYEAGAVTINYEYEYTKYNKHTQEISKDSFLLNALSAANDIYESANEDDEYKNKHLEDNDEYKNKHLEDNDEYKNKQIEENKACNKEQIEENKACTLLKAKQNIDLAIDQQILQCLACVGSCTSPLLSENNISLYSIYHKLHDCAYIANIKYNSGAVIGLNKAKKITDYVSRINDAKYEKTRIKILSTIPLISKKTAAIILKQIKLTDILEESINVADLANIKKTEKVKLGTAAASNIINYLIPKLYSSST
jgi:ERCC4-type nuclease